MSFPDERMRRMRRTEGLRRLVRETRVDPSELILPLFIVPGSGIRRPVGSMPGVEQLSADEALLTAEEAARAGLAGVLLFGIPETKDESGSSALDAHGPVQSAVRMLKRELPELPVITDVCLCEYTSHGHCGLLRNEQVDNDATLPLLARMALSHVEAGADVVAPSDMMDGRVAAIREALDAEGHQESAILSYAVKYASAFYGPFREAAESTPSFGDRRGYQMDPANADEALREAEQDIAEGADILMVKPALACLDVIRRVRETFAHPLFAYHVSGEYAMVHAAAQRGWLDLERAMEECLLAIRRAGASRIVTYHALEYARRHGR